jgi:hypothetical protein
MRIIPAATQPAAPTLGDDFERSLEKGDALGLGALADEAAGLEDASAPAAPAESVPTMSNADALLMAAQIFRTTLETVAKLKSPADTLADEKLAPAAAALGAVFDKYSWNLQALGGAYMLELTAVLTVAPLAWGAYQGIQVELAQAKADKAKSAAAKPGASEPEPAGAADGFDPGPAIFPPGDPRAVTLNG